MIPVHSYNEMIIIIFWLFFFCECELKPTKTWTYKHRHFICLAGVIKKKLFTGTRFSWKQNYRSRNSLLECYEERYESSGWKKSLFCGLFVINFVCWFFFYLIARVGRLWQRIMEWLTRRQVIWCWITKCSSEKLSDSLKF